MANFSCIALLGAFVALTGCNANLKGKGGAVSPDAAVGGSNDGDKPGVIDPNGGSKDPNKGPNQPANHGQFVAAKPSPGRVNANGKDIAIDLTKLDLPKEAQTVDIYLSPNEDCSNSQLILEGATLRNDLSVTAGTDGSYYLCYVVRDSESHIIAQLSEDSKIVIDTTPPVISAAGSPSPTSTTGSTTLTLTISDLTDVTTEWTVTGGTPQQTLSNSTSHATDFTSADDGVYEVVATVTDAKGNSETFTFQVTVDTQGPATTDATLVLTDVDASGAKISWTKAADIMTNATNLEYLVCVSTNSADVANAASCVTTGGANNFTKDIDERATSNLTPDTVYYVNVVVKDESGHLTAYTAQTFTTAPDTVAPSIGTFNTATAVNSHGFTISWTAASDDHTAANALKYLVCSSTSAATVSTEAGCAGVADMSLTAGVTSYTLTGKAPGTTYYVNVLVEDANGNQSLYAYTSQTTSPDTTPPAIGAMNATGSITHNSLTLNWTAASDNGTSATNLEYYICRASSDAAINTAQKCVDDGTRVVDFTANTTTYNVTGLSPNTAYYFRVVVRDTANNMAIYPSVSHTTNTYPPNLATPVSKISVSVDEAMSPYSFTNTGGTVTSCAVDPGLPNGLSVGVSGGTCRITGTPTAVNAETEYELTATAADGSSDEVVFDMEVVEVDRNWNVRTSGTAVFMEDTSMSSLKVATADNGDAIVAWSGTDGIYYKRKSNNVWDTSATKLPTATSNPIFFGLKMNASGHIAILYRESYKQYVAVFKNGAWVLPGVNDYAFDNSNVHSQSHLALSDNDQIIIAYEVTGGHAYVIEKSGDDPWQAPVLIGVGTGSFMRDLTINPSGDAAIGFGAINGSTFVCLASRKNGVWTRPASTADCYSYSGNPIIKVGISDNGRLAAVYSSQNQGYFIDHNGTSWQARVGWAVDSSISNVFSEDFFFDSISVSDNGDTSVIWRYGQNSNYTMTAFHSYKEGTTWHHPDLSGRIFTTNSPWRDQTVVAFMHPTKKGIIVSADYGGMGFGPVRAAAWSGDWSTPETTSNNLVVDGADAVGMAGAMSRNGFGIAAWIQLKDNNWNAFWINIAEFQ